MKKLNVFLISLMMGAFGVSAHADTSKVVDVKTVQKWIVQKHANWRAKESWVTHLSEAELERMLGLKTPPKGRLDYESARVKENTSLDWRNVNGVNWLGPVMNQGNCGSCVAFSTVATLEARTSIALGAP